LGFQHVVGTERAGKGGERQGECGGGDETEGGFHGRRVAVEAGVEAEKRAGIAGAAVSHKRVFPHIRVRAYRAARGIIHPVFR
jgi:hypothetical protein